MVSSLLPIDSLANDAKKRAYWEKECLCVVRERTTLQRSEEELSMAKRGLTLENERARAENEYRQLINLPGRVLLFASRALPVGGNDVILVCRQIVLEHASMAR